MEFNAVLSSTLGLKFLVLRTQLDASWATPRLILGVARLASSRGPEAQETLS